MSLKWLNWKNRLSFGKFSKSGQGARLTAIELVRAILAVFLEIAHEFGGKAFSAHALKQSIRAGGCGGKIDCIGFVFVFLKRDNTVGM